MTYRIECYYCGDITLFTPTMENNHPHDKCFVCGDKNLKIKPIESSDVFGYNNTHEELKRRRDSNST